MKFVRQSTAPPRLNYEQHIILDFDEEKLDIQQLITINTLSENPCKFCLKELYGSFFNQTCNEALSYNIPIHD